VQIFLAQQPLRIHFQRGFVTGLSAFLWVEIMGRIDSSFPLQPLAPRIVGVEIVFNLEPEPAGELLGAFADDQVMIRLLHHLAGDARRGSDAFDRRDAAGSLSWPVHAARIKLYDALGIWQAAVADAGFFRVELDNIDAGDELLSVICTDGKNQIFIATHHGMAVRFNESDVRSMGRATRGVRGVNLRKGDFVVSVCAVNKEGDQKILSVSEKGFGKQTQVSSYRLTKRGGLGVINMKTTDKTGTVVAAFPVEKDTEIMIITQQAKLIRLGVNKIRETGRSAQGVTLIKTGEDDLVTSASLLPIGEEEE